MGHGRCRHYSFFGLTLGLLLAGCAQPRVGREVSNRVELRRRAMECLKNAVAYRDNPVVRVEAVEALKGVHSAEGLPWIRSALLDDHPAVRFAACVAVGEVRDAGAEAGVAKALKDADAAVRVAALFARHRLGHTERTGDLAGYLLHDPDATVRRNAALVLGLLGERGAVKILAKGMKDADAGVRNHALEAMARLGNREARQELTFMTGAGVGSDEVFAINALAATGDPTYADTFRYKLATAAHLETRLAAARGLGLMHSDGQTSRPEREGPGFELAMRGLRQDRPMRSDPQDPAEAQILRTQQLAAAALGAIGRAEALPALTEVMEKSDDPRVQVSAAGAILDILDAERTKAFPFASGHDRRGR
jgi:HEAT repeat protein